MRDHATGWHELRPCLLGCPHNFLSACAFLAECALCFKNVFLIWAVTNKSFMAVSDNKKHVGWRQNSLCGLWCHSSSVLSLCLCCVSNINRAEKCPEWNEFVAAWSLSFLMMMMMISRVVEGNTLLCSTAEKQMTVFGSALFSAQLQCLIRAGVWVGYVPS